MQSRKFSQLKDAVLGFECSIEVADVVATAAAVEAAGGTIVMTPTAIAGVGRVAKFTDPDGNLCAAIQLDHAEG